MIEAILSEWWVKRASEIRVKETSGRGVNLHDLKLYKKEEYMPENLSSEIQFVTNRSGCSVSGLSMI